MSFKDPHVAFEEKSTEMHTHKNQIYTHKHKPHASTHMHTSTFYRLYIRCMIQ